MRLLLEGTSVLGGTRPVVPALPRGGCFGEGMRRGPGRASEGVWEGVGAPGVGAHPAGAVLGGVWETCECTPARQRARGEGHRCVCPPQPGAPTRGRGLLGLGVGGPSLGSGVPVLPHGRGTQVCAG